MVDHRKTHKLIQKIFHTGNIARRNLPFGSGMRYKRGLLGKLFAELNFKVGAEIGVRRGGFSKVLLDANPELMMYCIDPWIAYHRYTQEKQDDIFRQAVEKLSKYDVKILRKTSMDALSDIKDEELDFVYIDGNHRFDHAMMDIICWSNKVRSGGIVAVHDYFTGEVGVWKAVDAYVHSHDIRPWYTIKELAPTAYWVKP